MLHKFHAKMNRLPAHLTSEDDWKQDQPGVRLSRVFGVVLGIHIVAIGGLMAYEMFRHREPSPGNTSALRSAPREARPGSTAAMAPARGRDTFADEPAHDGMLKHVVAPGERLAGIAARYGVDERALQRLNRLSDGRSFETGMKLVIPNRQLKAAAPVPPDRLLATSPAGAPGGAEAAAETPAAVAAGAYDPTLEVRRAEPVAEPAAPKPVAATPSKPPARPTAAAKPSARPPATAKTAPATVAAKKPAAATTRKTETVSAKPKPKGRVHVVKDGENAYRIAKAYGVNVDQLIKTNGINPSTLRPGTPLTIPPGR
jgi:LysM repeat protein